MIPVSSREFFCNARILSFHATHACNLRCSYCSVDATYDGYRLPTLQPERCVEIIDFALEANGGQPLKVEITGGEPLLLGKQWFQKVLDHAQERRIGVGLTTNATLLDEEWAEMFRYQRVTPNVSLDGTAEVHNGQRDQHEQVVSGLKMLQRCGMSPHVITVASARVLKNIDKVLALYSALGIKTFYLNDVRDVGRGVGMEESLVPTPGTMADASFKVLVYMRKCRMASRELQILERVFRYFHTHYYGNICDCATCPAGNSFVSVHANGDVFPCPNETSPRYSLGNVFTGPDEQRRKAVLVDYHSLQPFYLPCLTCKASTICFFSCTASRKRSMAHAERDCEYTQILYELFCKNENLIADVYQMALPSRRLPDTAAQDRK